MGARTIFTAALLALAAAGCTSGSDNSVSIPIGGPATAPVATTAETSSDANDDDASEPEASPPPATVAQASEPEATTIATTPASTVAPPPPPPTPAPTTTAAPVFFSQGDEDPAIEIMQLKLITLGYLDSGSANGVFGPATNTALRNFQSQYGLGVDGVFGPLTDRALTAAANSVNVDDG